MIRMNARFADFLAAAPRPVLGKLQPGALTIIRKGLVESDGHVFLKEFLSRRAYPPKDWQEADRFEHWVNRFHLEDYASADLLGQSLLFIRSMLQQWLQRPRRRVLNAFVFLPKNQRTAVLSFHISRGRSLLADDLDDFQSEAVLEISSKDMSFFKLLR